MPQGRRHENMPKTNEILTSKRFIIVSLLFLAFLFAVAYIAPRKIHLTEEISLPAHSHPDSTIAFLKSADNFQHWNIWKHYDTTIVYSKDLSEAPAVQKLYWLSPENHLSKGHLFIRQVQANKVQMEANLAEQMQGEFVFTVLEKAGGKFLRIEYISDSGYSPIKRLHALFIPFYFDDELREIGKAIAKAVRDK